MTREEEIQKLIDEENGIVNYGSCDYQAGVRDGVRLADKNPCPQTIAEYLYKEKGYPISLNGEIPTFEETMKDVQTYNDYKAKQWLEKACKWLLDNAGEYMVVCWDGYWFNDVRLVKDLRKYLEEQL